MSRAIFPRPILFLRQHSNLLKSGRALDLACGRGGNSVFLAEAGYTVDAIDISDTVLSRLKVYADQRRLNIRCIIADLDGFAAANGVLRPRGRDFTSFPSLCYHP